MIVYDQVDHSPVWLSAILTVRKIVAYLSEQFYGRDGARNVSLRQVQVVDEDDALLAHGRPENALAAPVQLGHDDVLGVVDVGPGGEVDDVGDEALLGQAAGKRVGQE